jgi:carboxymethylenebutenolidase
MMVQKLNELSEDYAKGILGRREFLRSLALLAGGTTAAATLPPLLKNSYAAAQLIPQDDPRLQTGYIDYSSAAGQVRAYSVRAKGETRLPGVVVIHENRGLNPHIEDVARRVAAEGYIAVAPDALSPFGGTPEDPNEARPLFQKLDRQANTKNFVAAVEYLKTHPQSTGKVACMGFCWGGGVTNQVAVNSPDLVAAVPFYGSQRPKTCPKSERPC